VALKTAAGTAAPETACIEEDDTMLTRNQILEHWKSTSSWPKHYSGYTRPILAFLSDYQDFVKKNRQPWSTNFSLLYR
jgi:hypothetical protein